MQPYQEQYIQNVKEIAGIWQFTVSPSAGGGFESWYDGRIRIRDRMKELAAENASLLVDYLYPTLDSLYEADAGVLGDLEAFADCLMDWRTNLDCGVYVTIHDALLSLCRTRKDREGMIRELYKLGMGFYYLNRIVTGVECRETDAFRFFNEMLFTEASSYLSYFNTLDGETARGYVIRSLANITLCTQDKKKRVDISMRTLEILRDEKFRQDAPGLPWEAFIRKTHQQMSTNRSALRTTDLTKEEIAAVLDSCYEVFRQEDGNADPSVRWLWPYYNMEYNCGYVPLNETVDRLERMILSTPEDRYDMAGLYGNVELAIEYGMILERNPDLQKDEHRVAFLEKAYQKMMNTLKSFPPERFDDLLAYSLVKVCSDFYEADGLITYREVTKLLMARFAGGLYVHARIMGDLMAAFCRSIFRQDPVFFDDIPLFAGISDPHEKEEELVKFAQDCGLYHDFGLFQMNVERLKQTRPLFEGEDRRIRLHTVSGYDVLQRRKSTEAFADVARGHHSSYTESEEDPSGYVRIRSPYRKITDVAALTEWLAEHLEGPASVEKSLLALSKMERNRFSPPVLSYLEDADLRKELNGIFSGDGKEYYREIYAQLM